MSLSLTNFNWADETLTEFYNNVEEILIALNKNMIILEKESLIWESGTPEDWRRELGEEWGKWGIFY